MAILSGILVGTSYIPFPPWATFFCWIPLWIAWLNETSFRRVFLTGWLAQFVFTMIGFSWVSYTIHEFGHLPWPIAIFIHSLFGAFANLYVPLAGVVWLALSKRFQLHENARIAALPLLMSFGERTFPMIFDWHAGYTWLWAGFPAFHLADIFGFIGLSLFSLIFNALFFWAWRRRQQSKPWAAVFATPLLIFALLNVWGHFHKFGVPTPDAKANFLIVQANIGNQEKLLAEQGWKFRDVVIDRFARLTEQGLKLGPQIDFAVWPETAFPEIIEDANLSVNYPFKLRAYVSSWQTKLITGGYAYKEGTGQVTNSFFILNKEGRWLVPPYHKTILLAFGEYFPGASWFPWLPQKFPEIGNFGRGPGPTVMDAEGFKIGAQICYEGLFDWFSIGLATKGAEIIVNLTNDSWYGKWQQPYEHGYMTLARAIETRLPLVRSTNTGISTVILADGQILEQSPLHEEWFHLYEIPYLRNPPRTHFVTWGHWLVPTLMGLSLLAIVFRGRQKVK